MANFQRVHLEGVTSEKAVLYVPYCLIADNCGLHKKILGRFTWRKALKATATPSRIGKLTTTELVGPLNTEVSGFNFSPVSSLSFTQGTSSRSPQLGWWEMYKLVSSLYWCHCTCTSVPNATLLKISSCCFKSTLIKRNRKRLEKLMKYDVTICTLVNSEIHVWNLLASSN